MREQHGLMVIVSYFVIKIMIPSEDNKKQIHVPELAKDLLEQIGFEARKSEYVDAKSGVSTRMSITAFENLIR